LKSKIEIIRFLELAGDLSVIDVRAPSEYNAGHIPRAVNIPLFTDIEREKVGTSYTKEGRLKAVLKGLELTGPSMHLKLAEALKLTVERRLLAYCWRGGMRSEAMAWLFSLGGIETEILDGGYKSYRHHVLENLSAARKMIILGGLTGSGKTRILRHISEAGHQVTDLEQLANHKGSAFGSLGQSSQPSTEHFANLMFDNMRNYNPGRPLWLEDESSNIGNVFLPEEFYRNMQMNPAIVLLMDREIRLPALVNDYAGYSRQELIGAIARIKSRLGGENTREAIQAIGNGDFLKAAGILLSYYDKAYMYGLKKRQGKEIIYIETRTDDIKINTLEVLDAAERIKW